MELLHKYSESFEFSTRGSIDAHIDTIRLYRYLYWYRQIVFGKSPKNKILTKNYGVNGGGGVSVSVSGDGGNHSSQTDFIHSQWHSVYSSDGYFWIASNHLLSSRKKNGFDGWFTIKSETMRLLPRPLFRKGVLVLLDYQSQILYSVYQVRF